jgi:hypothetical protein
MSVSPRSGFGTGPIPQPPNPDDNGKAAPELQARLAQFTHGKASGGQVLAALADARVFVPVVAVLEDTDVATGALGQDQTVKVEKQSAMATVIAESAEHGKALLAFSSVRSLHLWRSDARPVAVPAPLAARAALVESADALLVDVAGPSPFAVSDYDLLLVAAVARLKSESGQDPADDPVLQRAIARLLPTTLQGQFSLSSGTGSDDNGTVTLRLPAPTPNVEELLRSLANDQVVRRLLPGSLRVVASDTPPPPGD